MNLFIQEQAEADILRHVERYVAQGLPHIAGRLQTAVLAAIDVLVARPEAGLPRPAANPALNGLRALPLKGFDGFWIHYLADQERVIVVRVLHNKRDIGIILEG